MSDLDRIADFLEEVGRSTHEKRELSDADRLAQEIYCERYAKELRNYSCDCGGYEW